MAVTYADGSYLTHKGTALVAKLLASKGSLLFTRVTVGDGTVPDGLTPEDMTDLAHYVKDGMIAAIENPSNGEASILVQVISTGLEVGFSATEIMLWAEDPDEGEIAYTYFSLAQHPEWIRPEGDPVQKLASFTLITVVDSVALVNVVIHPDAFARAVDLSKYALIGHTHQISDIIGLQDSLEAHNLDVTAHPYILGRLADIDSWIALLRLMFLTNVTGNPFVVTFANLEGTNVTGVWNSAQKRIEF